ncbi:Protein of unknown function [Chryseobacterium shigense]|uniref:DUF1569 domain-containing protein n=1 Tax=Chryseobacterium shigense TaxID=297244 RepID=A0A1N7HTP1_9FLAO|nr:DUF1569 domain-containing protein [Chryseobacterium shigense]SIS28185.1 Protein of unknown function [Chryseobacterium shigense]
MVKKSLHDPVYFEEIVRRISLLDENTPQKWGEMNASQMLKHCELVLKVALGKIELPEINIFFKAVGAATKIEMQIFNNGIPRNMPTFQKLIVNFECDFDESKTNLLNTMKDFRKTSENKALPDHHRLFGTMTEKDWGFLEYKHLDHHLKQFNV